MTNQIAELDLLLPPPFSANIGDADQQLILLLLEAGKQQVRPFTGTFHAPWLLTPFEADIWQTTNRGREELVSGHWENSIPIDWRVVLPNALLMTDAQYERLLLCVKKIAFFMRSNLISGCSAPVAWRLVTYRLIGLARWVVLHEHMFQPALHGFQLIDQDALEWLFSQIAEGGWTQAMQIPQRFLAKIYYGAHGSQCPPSLLKNPYSLPSSDIEPLVKWLDIQGAYTFVNIGTHVGKRYIRREWLAKLINENGGGICNSIINHLCRQLEPDFAEYSLLVSLKQTTELPPHWIVSTEDIEVGGTQSSMKANSALFASVLDAHHLMPDLVPEPSTLSTARAAQLTARIIRPSGHTPFIPINTGLAYLNMAMRFVSVYGESILGLYLSILRNRKMRNREHNSAMKRNYMDWCVSTGEPITSVLNITEFRRQDGCRDFDRFRNNPSLDDALRVLIGSCIVCIAGLKPSREGELTHLNRNCIRFDENGYWINFELGKSNVKGVEAWQQLDRPIPLIAAKAIQLLQRLGEGFTEKCSESRKFVDNLFCLPNISGFGTSPPSKHFINLHLDLFCDFVGLPSDSEGRRWYVRVHEMRKWFLLLLFWSGRFDVLDAGRWVAGHTDSKHLYDYIQKEIPGDELPELEADYAVDRLYRQDQARRRGLGSPAAEDDSATLYEAVLRHFNVESLSLVPESEWTAYIHSMRNDSKFHLEPHSIFGENGRDVVGINVSFVMRLTT